ncbi:MAG: DDE-type integrase/transposase/recombinase [Desulfosarcina sp.]|nr:DDE-type integrase/transposase/recombinase [Desulfobacterales bacterium]
MTGKKNETIAVFRFGVIHEFVGATNLSNSEKRRLLREKCARKWVIPYSGRTRISENTIYRWIRRYRKSGARIASLYPGKRGDRGQSRKLDEETINIVLATRRGQMGTPVPMLLEGLKRETIVSATTGLSTLYRLFHRHGLMDKSPQPEDRRKFEAELVNDIWQSDVMHAPKVMVNQRRRKTYLIAFIDDHSRLIVFGGFYLSENLACFMEAFEKALSRRGLPRKLYVDNGAAYRSHKLAFTCACLAIALIHARPYKPQGKGKIERFFKTVRSGFLPTADLASLERLNQSFTDWLDTTYHQRIHSATGMTPFDRFSRNLTCIRKAPKDLKDHFRNAVYRSVAKDRTITLNGNLFEAPVALIGKRVQVRYHEHEPKTVEVFFNQTSHGLLVPVDLHVNCRVKRDRNKNTQLETAPQTDYHGGDLWR